MRSVRSTSLLILLLGCPATSWALNPDRALTQYLHRIWQVPQGLPQATVFAIRQTRDGYLWLGTRTGLVRFDGVRFSPLQASGEANLKDVWVRDFLEDPAGDLWIATNDAGLIRYRQGETQQFAKSSGLPSDCVQSLLVDRDGSLWIGTDRGLARMANGELSTASELPQHDIRALCRRGDGTTWIGGAGPQVGMWDGKTLATRRFTPLPPQTTVLAMLEDAEGTLWIGTSNGLLHVRGEQEQLFTTADGLPDNSILCLAQGSGGTLWVGTKEGFSRVHQGEIDSFRAQDGLSQRTVYTICEDREGSLWIGTKHGLNQLVDRRSIPFTTSEGLPTNETGPVLQDKRGSIWIGTLGDGLSRYDGRHFTVYTDQVLTNNPINALANDDQGSLWIGTDKGLRRLDEDHVKPVDASGLPSPVVRCLLQDHTGVLWAGTANGLTVLRDGHFVEQPLRAPILALAEHQGELLVAAGGEGLFRYRDGKLEPVDLGSHVTSDIDAIFSDAEGLLWLGTRGSGLCLVRDGKVFVYSTRNGLYDDDIYGVVADDQGRMWMACSQGIFSIPRAELLRFASGEINVLQTIPFSPTDGLRTIECKADVQPAAWKADDGRVWFSTIRGLIVIDANRLERSRPPAPAVVEEVSVNGKSENPARLGSLPPGRTNLTFHYTALSFLSPTRLTFRYKLENFDKEWVEAGSRREAFYTNLPPGSYDFRLAARNVDGPWVEASHRVTFTLEPYIYQRTWFLPLCVCLAGLAVWLAYRLRVRRIKERLHAIVGERTRIARELHDTLMQGFSGITMEMQALSTRLTEPEQRSALAEIIDDAGVCLREARHSIAGLRGGEDPPGLAAAVAQAARQITETKDVQLRLKLGPIPTLPADAQYHVLRIAQEALLNAVKHAGARAITVSLETAAANGGGEMAQLSIVDDGAGFDAENGQPGATGHYGLLGMQERANQINADLRVTSAPGRGTSVVIAVPLALNGSLPHAAGEPAR